MTMKRAIRSAIYGLYARGFPPSPPLQSVSCRNLSAPFVAFSPPRSRLYSSGNHNRYELDSTSALSEESSIEDDVSTEELKRKIDRFYRGDVESLPSIFEAILKRKLSGKHDEADDELMKELRQQLPGQVENFDDSDADGIHETDEEMEDSSDAEEDDEMHR